MPAAPKPEEFGLPSSCRTVADVCRRLADHRAERTGRRSAAAFGMASAAWDARTDSPWHADGLRMLDALSASKSEIDIAASHGIDTVTVTAAVLFDTQLAVDEATFPCTEWLTSHEVADIAVERALHHARTLP